MKAALFDFDGTLADSMPVWSEKVSRLLTMQGIAVPPDFVRTVATLGDAGAVRYIIENFDGNRLSAEQMQCEMDAYALPRYRDEIPAKAGVEEYLAALSRAGIGIYLLTASPKRMFLPCLERLGLRPYFNATWCTDDFGIPKSNPEIYRMAAERIGCRTEEIDFFDDNATALRTARLAGCRTVGVYDDTSREKEGEIRAVADQYIYSFTELL